MLCVARSLCWHRSVRPPRPWERERLRELTAEKTRWGYRFLHLLIFVASHRHRLLFATVLHLFGDSTAVGLPIPPHRGNCSRPRVYPVLQAPIMATSLLTD
jgi:hypothetical protein